jgi:hypothetical protein
MRLGLLVAFSAVAVTLAAATEATAQPEPLLIFRDTNQTAIFCKFESSETGDNPDTIDLRSPGKGQFLFNPWFQESGLFSRISRMRPGTPLSFKMSIIYFYLSPEIGGNGGMETRYMLETFSSIEGQQQNSAICSSKNISYGEFASSASGHFCGYEAGAEGKDAELVSIMTGVNIYSFKPRLDIVRKHGPLTQLAIGTPISYDMMIFKNIGANSMETSPPTLAITDFESAGNPVPEACTPAPASQN